MKFSKVKDIKGLTIVELIITMVIVGIVVAAISFRMNSGIDSMKIRAAVSQIRDHLRMAQSRAKLTQERYLVSFDTVNNTYAVYKSINYPVGNAVKEPRSGNYLSFDLDTDKALEGGTVFSISFGDGTTGEIEFDARGQPHDGKGGSLLGSEATVTIEYNGSSATIKIQPMTGDVVITY